MRRRSFGVLADAALGLALGALSLVVFQRATEVTPFHGDESEWISASRYFEYFFLDRDYDSQVWRSSWLNRDQPPVGRYTIGGVLWASGQDVGDLNKTYAWDKSLEENRRDGRIPGPSLLVPVRSAMAVFGALSVLGLYVAGRLLDGPLTGAVAALLVTFSPLIQQYFSQARTEGLLAFVTSAALVGMLATARRFELDGRIPRAAWAIGIVFGLALATKLTAALAIAATAAYGGTATLARLLARRVAAGRAEAARPCAARYSDAPGRSEAHRSEALRMGGWTAATLGLAGIVWVAVNPFLWPDPFGRTWSMLDQQSAIMVEQGERFGNPVTAGVVDRVLLVAYRTFVENSTPAFDANLPPGSDPIIRPTLLGVGTGGVTLELLLAIVGLVALVARALPAWRLGGRHGPATALLWWVLAYWLGIAANLSLDWPRYYVPTAFVGSLLVGLAVSVLGRLGYRLLARGSTVATMAGERRVGAAH